MPKSDPYWWEDAGRPVSPPAMPLPSEVDVVIVGAGLTGLSAARTLARRGRQVEAVERLLADRPIDSTEITGIVVETFEEATLLSQSVPRTTEEAQYNVPFPVAVILARGQIGAAEVADQALFRNPEIMRLTDLIEMRTRPATAPTPGSENFATCAIPPMTARPNP